MEARHQEADEWNINTPFSDREEGRGGNAGSIDIGRLVAVQMAEDHNLSDQATKELIGMEIVSY